MGIMYLSNLTHTAFEFRLEKEKAVLQKGVDMYDSMDNKDPAALASFEDFMLAHCSQYVHGRPAPVKVDHLVPPEGTACLTCVPHALVYMSNIDQYTIKEWRLHAFNEVFCLVFRGKQPHHEHDAEAILDGWDGSTCVVPVLRRFGERRRRYAVSKTNRFLAKDNFLQYCNLNPLVEIIEVDDLLDQGAKNTPHRKQTKRVWAMRCAQRAKALLALRPAQLLYIDLQRDLLFTPENAAVVEASVQYCATCERVRCIDEMMMCGGGCADPPHYCDEQCQRKGWKVHKKECKGVVTTAAE